MKRFIFCLPLVLMTVLLQAQVKTENFSMSQGNNPALDIYLRKTNTKQVQDAWEKFIKDYKGKTKFNKKTGEIFTDNATIEKMSQNTVDVYAKVLAKGDDTELMVWFDLGGAYLTDATHPDRYPAGVQLLEDFKLLVSKAAMEEDLKDQESVLKKMNGDLEDLKKEEGTQEEEIAKYEKKIEEARQKIKEAQTSQAAKSKEIMAQEVMIKEMKKKLDSLK